MKDEFITFETAMLAKEKALMNIVQDIIM